MKITLKNVMKTYEADAANNAKAKNVLKPPCKTAGPTSYKACVARAKK